jgi:O-antigen/teichoic acid export membrane protein
MSVRRNAAFNVLGTILPLVAGVIAVPMLLRGLGEDRLGIFTLALGLIGFAGIFDLGLGRALTQTIASEIGRGTPTTALAQLLRRTLPVVFGMGLGWGAILWSFSGPLVDQIFHLHGQLAAESEVGLKWLAVSLPIALVSTSLIGALEGLQHFSRLNILRVPLSLASFLVPALISLHWRDVGIVIGSLVFVRIVGLFLWAGALATVFPIFSCHTGKVVDRQSMWRFTGWLTVTNIVGPIMVYADRFYLASLFSPAIVASYTTPLDTIFRGAVLPQAAMSAVFPALAHEGADSPRAKRMLLGAGWLMLALWGTPLLVAAHALPWALNLWVGDAFALKITPIAQWFLLGVFMNGFAHLPYALLQSAGRADLTAKLHLAELPLYALILVSLVGGYGILGAALAWSARVAFDTLMLHIMAMAMFPALRQPLGNALVITTIGAVALAAVLFALQPY